jgi:hypothetical protein
MTIDGAAAVRKKLHEIVPEYFEPNGPAEPEQATQPAVLRLVAGRT